MTMRVRPWAIRRFGTAVLVSWLLSAGAGRVSAGFVIVNPSFEDDDYSSVGIDSQAPVTGWTKSSTSSYPLGIHTSQAYQAADGDQFVVLGGFDDRGTSSLSQTITSFTVGATYQLSFAIASQYDSINPAYLQVSFTSGSATPAETYGVSIPGGSSWRLWQPETYEFVASATSATLHLNGLAAGSAVGIDHFQLTAATTAVPEPSTLVGAVTGLLLIVSVEWIKRRVATN
jgi:hypothetical protein